MRKYILSSKEKKKVDGIILYRIKAVKTFFLTNGTRIEAGTYGGFVENEKNLSQEDSCWILNDAMAYGFAKVMDDAILCDFSIAKDEAIVYGDAIMTGNSVIQNKAILGRHGEVHDRAIVKDIATIFGIIKGHSCVFGNAIVGKDATVKDFSSVGNNIVLKGNTEIKNKSYLKTPSRNCVTIKNSVIDCSSDTNILKNFCKNRKKYITRIENAQINSFQDVIIFPIKTYSDKNFVLVISNNSYTVGNYNKSSLEELLEMISNEALRSHYPIINNDAFCIYNYFLKSLSIDETLNEYAENLFNSLYKKLPGFEKGNFNRVSNDTKRLIKYYYWAQLIGIALSLNSCKDNFVIENIIENSVFNIKTKQIEYFNDEKNDYLLEEAKVIPCILPFLEM